MTRARRRAGVRIRAALKRDFSGEPRGKYDAAVLHGPVANRIEANVQRYRRYRNGSRGKTVSRRKRAHPRLTFTMKFLWKPPFSRRSIIPATTILGDLGHLCDRMIKEAIDARSHVRFSSDRI